MPEGNATVLSPIVSRKSYESIGKEAVLDESKLSGRRAEAVHLLIPAYTGSILRALPFLGCVALLLAIVVQSGCVGVTTAKGSNSAVAATDQAVSSPLTASPSALDFGNVSMGGTGSQSLVLTNSGTAPLTISQDSISGAGLSISGATLPVTLSPGDSTAFTATFTPSTAGDTSGTVSFLSPQLRQGYGVGWHGTGKPVAPIIRVPPASQSVLAGQVATFAVTASGTAPLSYQWIKNGIAISGANSSSYITPNTTSADNGAQFDVVVSNSVGTITSSTAILTVSSAPVPPSITSQPANQTTLAGQTATFSVNASGTAPLSYQWQKNGSAIGGATSVSYTTPATTSSDNGAQFAVVVSNSAGTVVSNAATLTVNPAATAPSITTQPLSQTIVAGQTGTFSVTASGTAPLSYQWQKNGVAITGASSSTYTTAAVVSSDNGAQFTVVVSNSAGTATSNAAILTVTTPPAITSQPTSQTVSVGQTATFSVTATGTAPLTYQWRKNGANIASATASTYTTPATVSADTGAQFTVIVNNAAGAVTSNVATLTVNVPPSITSQPTSQSITAGQTATFSVSASGTNPITYQWKKNGTAISGATSASYTTPAETTADNGAQFTLVITNVAGSVTSNPATLTVSSAAVAPSITTQPASQTITAGQTATFSVTATGTSPLTYQWQKNGAAITGATASAYTTPAETTADNGAQFAVMVSNSAGTVTSNTATLAVSTPGQLSSSTSTLAFGNVNISANSTQSATLTNSGGSAVSITNVTISGAGFTETGASTGTILNPGASLTMNVTFAPAASGAVTGTVTISSSASNSPLVISLSGTGQTVAHSVTLTWTASASVVVGYNLYRGSTSGGPYTKINSTIDANTTFVDTAVLSGQTYYYVATAVDANNAESPYSNETTALIP